MKKSCFLLYIFVCSICVTAQETPLSAQQKRTAILDYAKTFIGTPYVYGGSTRSGMDCSGFIFTVVKDTLGTSVPRTASQLYTFADPIPRDQLEPGDLVFFKPSSSSAVNHVGFYMGRNQMIHAASDGPNTGVILSSLSENYWSRNYYSSGRLLPSTKNSVQHVQNTADNEKSQSTVLSASLNNTSSNSSSIQTFKNVNLEVALNGAWFLFDSSGFNPAVKGFNLNAGLLFNNKMSLNAGIRYDATIDSFLFPVYASIGLANNFWLMLGISPLPEARIDLPLYVGISWNRELYRNNILKLSFTQDFSYTAYDINIFDKWFSNAPEKMNFSTGLKVTFFNS